MALIVETGTAAADSEALCSVAFCDTYHAAQGNALWAPLLTAAKEQAIRKGYAFMQQSYRMRWAGFRVSSLQALDWPRYDVPRIDGYGGSLGIYGGIGCYPYDAIPKELQQANAELALRAASGDLLADLDPTVASESVGPISVTYFKGEVKSKKYPAVDRLLAPFIRSGGAMLLSRA